MHALLAIWTCWPLVASSSASKPHVVSSCVTPQEDRAAEQVHGPAPETADGGQRVSGGADSTGHSLRRLCLLCLQPMQACSWPPCLAELHAELFKACRQNVVVSKESECQALYLLRPL